MEQVWQQGDVVFIRVKKIPRGAEHDKKFEGIVQYGEATGHAHRLSGKEKDMYQYFSEGRRYLSLVKPMNLSHEEHNTIQMPAGDFEIRIVRELDWFSDMVRPVVD